MSFFFFENSTSELVKIVTQALQKRFRIRTVVLNLVVVL